MRFRAWHKNLKQMFPVDGITGMHSDKYSQIPQAVIFVTPEEFYGCSLELLELMQCTEFTDSEDKNIYEGDIISVDWDCDGFIYYQVQFNQERGWWEFYDRANKDRNLFEDLNMDGLKIIGNIYENPELLEQA